MEPGCGLVQGRDGALYGNTLSGSRGYDGGGIFKLNTDGTGYSILYVFAYAPFSSATMIQGRDGALYGTTMNGGANSRGTIFRINTNGSDYTEFYSFTTPLTEHISAYPSALTQGRDGALYGTTLGGGIGNAFRVKTDGTDFQALWWFAAASGYDAELPGGLILGRDDSFYGASQAGGTSGYGAVFKLTVPTGAHALLDNLGVGLTDGMYPGAALAQGSDGTLYGTAAYGGNGGNGSAFTGSGTLFKVSPVGKGYSTFYRFSANGSTGRWPSGVVLGSDGGLYGGAGGGSNAAGVLYRVNTDGTGYKLLHTFTTNGNDGQYPSGTPIQGHDGALYGITSFGGNIGTNPIPPGFGTVYRVNTNGSNYAVIFRFSTNLLNGAYPSRGLLQAADGALYGMGMTGSNHCGFVYKLNTNGTGYTVRYNFLAAGGDGSAPNSLIQGGDGWLYGTTFYGGSNDAGTVFRLNPSGQGYSQLYAFSTNAFDGQTPEGIVQGRDGRLYGTTQSGGDGNLGTVFQINPNGTGYAVIYSFVGADGEGPLAPPIQGLDGALYGTLSAGGTNGAGTVFRLALSPGEFTATAMLPGRVFQYAINAGALDYRIDASTDLLTWVTLTNVLNASGQIRFTDPNAASFPRRFYRAVWSPY
jgi:uncharacterized repeat protein (TIGR03803 family)